MNSNRNCVGSNLKEEDDDDRLSSSSVESLNRILFPSKDVLEKIEAAKKQREKSLLKADNKKAGRKKTLKQGTKSNFKCQKRKVKNQVILEPSASKQMERNAELGRIQKKDFRSGKNNKKNQVNLERVSKKSKKNSSKVSLLHKKNFTHGKYSSLSKTSAPKKGVMSKMLTDTSHQRSACSKINKDSTETEESSSNLKLSTSFAASTPKKKVMSIAAKRSSKKLVSKMLTDTSHQRSACSKINKDSTETEESSSNLKLSTSFAASTPKKKVMSIAAKRSSKKLVSKMLTDTSHQRSACSKINKDSTEALEESSSNLKLSTSFAHCMLENKFERDEINCPNSSASKTLKCDNSETFENVTKNAFQPAKVSNTPKSMTDPQTSTLINQNTQSHDEDFENVNLYFYLIKRIVEMNTIWLYQRGDSTKPPHYFSENANKLPLSFSSHNEYVNSFLPLIMLEIWEKICLESKPVVLSKAQNRFKFSVLSCNKDNDLLKLQCNLVINNTVSYAPCDESLVILDFEEARGKISTIFGFVTHHEKVHKHKVLQNSNVLRFSVHIKFKPNFFPAQGVVMNGNGICSLAHEVKLADALSSLKFSPVLDDILKPTLKTFYVPRTEYLYSHNYLSIQNEICTVVGGGMRLPTKKIILLEGPPGSGKTEVIPRICEKLVCDDYRICILVTAPSDVAVDEIANQFIDLKDRQSIINSSILRLGNSENISEDVLPYSLHRKLEIVREIRKKEYSDLQFEKDKISRDIQYCLRNQNLDISFLQDYQGLKIKEQELNNMKISEWNENTEEEEKRKICANANVILSKLDNYFEICKYGLEFSCCFIDEINQATEPESLLPFTLKINKFFIIGDRMQLPPVVKSQIAIDCGLQRSIMERFLLHFHSTYHKSPAITLTNQFRMHREVSCFPMKCFYSSNAIYSLADDRSENSLFKPYIILDDLYYSDNQSSDIRTGVCAILKICSYILHDCFATSVGVIVPSQYEKELYLSELRRLTTSSIIEIDTVEAFQGREKSVIVVSCYHESFLKADTIFTNKRRLNVALTRACRTVIICGPVHLINECPLPYWKRLYADAHQRECYKSFSTPNDIPEILKTFRKHSVI